MQTSMNLNADFQMLLLLLLGKAATENLQVQISRRVYGGTYTIREQILRGVIVDARKYCC